MSTETDRFVALGIIEAAELLGVSRQAFHTMRAFGNFPAPDVTIGGHVGWFRKTVEHVRTIRAEGRTR